MEGFISLRGFDIPLDVFALVFDYFNRTMPLLREVGGVNKEWRRGVLRSWKCLYYVEGARLATFVSSGKKLPQDLVEGTTCLFIHVRGRDAIPENLILQFAGSAVLTDLHLDPPAAPSTSDPFDISDDGVADSRPFYQLLRFVRVLSEHQKSLPGVTGITCSVLTTGERRSTISPNPMSFLLSPVFAGFGGGLVTAHVRSNFEKARMNEKMNQVFPSVQRSDMISETLIGINVWQNTLSMIEMDLFDVENPQDWEKLRLSWPHLQALLLRNVVVQERSGIGAALRPILKGIENDGGRGKLDRLRMDLSIEEGNVQLRDVIGASIANVRRMTLQIVTTAFSKHRAGTFGGSDRVLQIPEFVGPDVEKLAVSFSGGFDKLTDLLPLFRMLSLQYLSVDANCEEKFHADVPTLLRMRETAKEFAEAFRRRESATRLHIVTNHGKAVSALHFSSLVLEKISDRLCFRVGLSFGFGLGQSTKPDRFSIPDEVPIGDDILGFERDPLFNVVSMIVLHLLRVDETIQRIAIVQAFMLANAKFGRIGVDQAQSLWETACRQSLYLSLLDLGFLRRLTCLDWRTKYFVLTRTDDDKYGKRIGKGAMIPNSEERLDGSNVFVHEFEKKEDDARIEVDPFSSLLCQSLEILKRQANDYASKISLAFRKYQELEKSIRLLTSIKSELALPGDQPAAFLPRMLSLVRMNLMRCLLMKGQTRRALQCSKMINEALLTPLQKHKLFFRIGIAFERLEDFPRAIKAFQTSLALNPENQSLAIRLEKLHRRSGGV